MPATALPTVDRFFRPDITKVIYLPAVANAATGPTRAEINAGTDLSDEVADTAGWTISGAEIDTPDLGSTFNSKIPGRTSVDDSSLTMYQSTTGADARTVLPRGTTGFILWADGGDVPASKADLYPIRVRSVGKVRSTGDEAARMVISFSITRQPTENVTIPAAV